MSSSLFDSMGRLIERTDEVAQGSYDQSLVLQRNLVTL